MDVNTFEPYHAVELPADWARNTEAPQDTRKGPTGIEMEYIHQLSY